LRDLSKGDEPGGEPVRNLFDDRQPVVGVHDGVHGVVHGDEDDAGVFVGVSEPGKEKDRHVVVPILFAEKKGKEEDRELRVYVCVYQFSPLPPFPPLRRTYQCKKIGSFCLNTTNTVSSNSATFDKTNA